VLMILIKIFARHENDADINTLIIISTITATVNFGIFAFGIGSMPLFAIFAAQLIVSASILSKGASIPLPKTIPIIIGLIMANLSVDVFKTMVIEGITVQEALATVLGAGSETAEAQGEAFTDQASPEALGTEDAPMADRTADNAQGNSTATSAPEQDRPPNTDSRITWSGSGEPAVPQSTTTTPGIVRSAPARANAVGQTATSASQPTTPGVRFVNKKTDAVALRFVSKHRDGGLPPLMTEPAWQTGGRALRLTGKIVPATDGNGYVLETGDQTIRTGTQIVNRASGLKLTWRIAAIHEDHLVMEPVEAVPFAE